MRIQKLGIVFLVILFLVGCNSNEELTTLQAQNKQLQNKIDQLNTEKTALTSELEEMKSLSASLKDDLDNARAEINRLRDGKNPILELEVIGSYNNNLNYLIREVNQRSQTVNIIGYNMDRVNENFKTINIQGVGNGERFKVKVFGSIYDFQLVEINYPNQEVRVIKQFEEVRNENIIINTTLPEGGPVEKIKWKDPKGKQYELLMGYDGYGFDGTIIWNK